MKYITVVRIGIKPFFRFLKWILPKQVVLCANVKVKGKVFFRAGVGDYVYLKKKIGKIHEVGFVYPSDALVYRIVKVRGNPMKAINPKRSKELLDKVK